MNVQKFLAITLNKLILLICICSPLASLGIPTGIISVVYNLRVSETTQLITEEFKDPFGLAFTSFETARWQNKIQHQKKHDTSNAVGELATFLYMAEPCDGHSWYMRADFAVARISETSNGTSLARVQTDDLLFAAGYSWSLHSLIRFTISSLLGIPTHKDTSLDQTQFGVGHVGLGIQFDAAVNYYPKNKCSLRMAARIIGTVPRAVRFEFYDYNYNLGEIIDLFVAHHAPIGNHCFEVGYNPTFVLASGLSPNVPTIASQLNLIRNSYYMAYEYNFVIKKISNAVEFGLSFSSDVIPKKTGQKLIVFGWFTWDLGF